MFLVVQLSIPILRFGDGDRAQRFAWQMFSTAEQSPVFVVHTQDETMEIALGDFMARVRADIDIVSLMPPHLCEVVPDADRVTWETGEHVC